MNYTDTSRKMKICSTKDEPIMPVTFAAIVGLHTTHLLVETAIGFEARSTLCRLYREADFCFVAPIRQR